MVTDQPDLLMQRGILDDPWLDGDLRVDFAPVIVSSSEAAALAETACTTLMLLDALVPTIARRQDLQVAIGLDPSLQTIVALDAPRWLGLARVDVFAVDGQDEPVACEVNCDTPTGLAETTELAAIADPLLGADPSARLRERWVTMVCNASPQGRAVPVVGLIDATDLTEDIGHVRLLERWLIAAGMRVVRGSPFNVTAMPGERIGLFGVACDVIVRHYKADWWAERRPLWHEESPPPDAGPLVGPLALIARAMAAGTIGVANPWGAAIAQSKRTLALPWEAPELVSADLRAAVALRIPETRFLESIGRARLQSERADWVLKSDFGCEGEEVILGRDSTADAWRVALDAAAPGRWVVQRAFTPRLDDRGQIRNHGIFTIGGLPSGIYTRCSIGPTTSRAVARATLISTGITTGITTGISTRSAIPSARGVQQ